MLFFAYGSKMDADELRLRCPSAQFVAVAKLPNHRLSFTAYSESHNCGIVDAMPQPGSAIWGVVYDIPEVDFARLDQREGYAPGRPAAANDCLREQRHVYRNGHEEEPILAWLYLAKREPHTPVPSSTYMGRMVNGARFWHLPTEYIEQLQHLTVA